MKTDVELVLSKVRTFSVEELLTVQETLTAELRLKAVTNGNGHKTQVSKNLEREAILEQFFLPRPNLEEVEARLERMFTPEERSWIGKTDFDRLPIGVKSVSQMIIEDREDRFY